MNTSVAVNRDIVVAAGSLVGSVAEGMREGVAASDSQPVIIPHREDRLQAVVVGSIIVPISIDVLEVRELSVERSRELLVRSVRRAFTAGQTGVYRRLCPPRTDRTTRRQASTG